MPVEIISVVVERSLQDYEAFVAEAKNEVKRGIVADRADALDELGDYIDAGWTLLGSVPRTAGTRSIIDFVLHLPPKKTAPYPTPNLDDDGLPF